MFVKIETLVDEQKLGWFNVNLLFWSFLAMFTDGYDITAISFAVPALVRSWHVAAPAFGMVLSASLLGIFFGAPLLGYVGDRYGRKTAIVAGCMIYGVATLAMTSAHSLREMTLLRFITGVGIGGLIANTIALNLELAPKRWRATSVVLMSTGVTFGGATPGLISRWLVPQYGWGVLFLIGGIAPLLIAVCLMFALPESVKYLALQTGKRRDLLRTLRRLRPDAVIPDDADFCIPSTPEATGLGLRKIFGGGLAVITPLLWFCFLTCLMVLYLLGGWMPVFFERSGMAPAQAALATSLFSLGGAVGGVLISLLLNRFGFAAIAALYALGGAAVAGLGIVGIGHDTLMVLSALTGFSVLGIQLAINATSGLLYPTPVRAKGVGWALGVGRSGSILGPLIGAKLLAMHLRPDQLFRAAAVPLLVGLVAAIVLARLSYLRFGRFQLDDAPAAAAGSYIAAPST
jgi:AAHS family 4-hydroxybenzoate transporter-like MFS transporter